MFRKNVFFGSDTNKVAGIVLASNGLLEQVYEEAIVCQTYFHEVPACPSRPSSSCLTALRCHHRWKYV